MRAFALVAVAASLAAPAYAAPRAPAAKAAAGWVVDKSASRLGFVAAMNGQAINGAFQRWDARIVFDPAQLGASSVFATIDTASSVTGDQTRDESLPTPDWFASKAFPQASFTSHRFVALGGGRYQVQGDLRIRNVVRPVVLPFTLVITGDTAKMNGSVDIDRTVFGVGQGQFKGTEAVAGKVQVTINLTAHRVH
jgi:polyisoprenoid-binding protein YceI